MASTVAEAIDTVVAALRDHVPEGSVGDVDDASYMEGMSRGLLGFLTHPNSPLKLNTEQLITFTRRLHGLAQEEGQQLPLERTFDAIHLEMAEPAHRIISAIGCILDYHRDLVETDPLIKDHRAWVIDQVLQILAGDRYHAMREALGTPYNEGVEPAPLATADQPS